MSRRLVQNEDFRFTHQRLDDLDALLHAHGEVLHQGVGIDVEAVLIGNLPDFLPGFVDAEHTAERGRFRAEGNVFRHGKDGDQHEVLVHHADAGRHRVTRSTEIDRLVIYQDLAGCWLVQPVQHVHEG
jgi:hypothetical protein